MRGTRPLDTLSHPADTGSPMGYRLLPHTADLRVAIEAPDLPGLYQAAVDMVRAVLVGASPVAPAAERTLALAAPDDAERFFRFVRELLYLYDVEGFLPASVILSEPLRVWGEAYDPDRHLSEHQVKAVTRHGYVFRIEPDGIYAELVLDL